MVCNLCFYKYDFNLSVYYIKGVTISQEILPTSSLLFDTNNSFIQTVEVTRCAFILTEFVNE